MGFHMVCVNEFECGISRFEVAEMQCTVERVGPRPFFASAPIQRRVRSDG